VELEQAVLVEVGHGELHLDALRAAGRDGVDGGGEEVAVAGLEQRRVAEAADDAADSAADDAATAEAEA
jgi:hypothetical protein